MKSSKKNKSAFDLALLFSLLRVATSILYKRHFLRKKEGHTIATTNSPPFKN